ncbi:MAG: Asp-tRNA(Asn)/Glu-tRNA(Gln) amidotransferase subunit GatB [Kiritimatiellia bacterium]
MDYAATIGLETHVQLKTRSKLFCNCPNRYGAPPNTLVCPICLGYPGSLPVINEEAVRLTVLTGLMLGSTINPASRFDRKSYFYPDMPKNFQISQYEQPLCSGGAVEFEMGGQTRRVVIRRIHLEEDVGKNTHFAHASGVDFNRAGVPLMEIVSEPEIHSPEEAYAYLHALRQILLYGGVSDCNLEEGNIRCDVNCSVSRAEHSLGTKTEIKNLNSFKAVLHALRYEIGRQIELLSSGGAVTQETRRWDAENGVTVSVRTKEEEHDYRYFPEPDLMPLVLDTALVERWRAELPEMPRDRRRRFVSEYGLPEYDAGVLVADKAVADFFEATTKLSGNPKAVSNWVMTEMLRLLSEKELEVSAVRITPQALAQLIQLVEKGLLNSNTAKEVFAILSEKGGDPGEIVHRMGLVQVSDEMELNRFVEQAIAANPKSVEDYRKGKKAAAQFLVGCVMRMTRGKANPQIVAKLVERKLADARPPTG